MVEALHHQPEAEPLPRWKSRTRQDEAADGHQVLQRLERGQQRGIVDAAVALEAVQEETATAEVDPGASDPPAYVRQCQAAPPLGALRAEDARRHATTARP
ncbi:hypothetical protein GCM10010329_62720 [Streptomyces spiroverticillatus]|nr:hypothetical protein GCM10010329_62720 [Streptomyces spiroverticillatus]